MGVNLNRVLAAAALLWAALAGVAQARVFLSTPVSPPEGFAWVAPVSFLLLAAANFWLLRRVGGTGWRGAALVAGAAVGLGGLGLYWFGSWVAHTSSHGPPGLGWGEPVLRSFGWADVGEFVSWNVIGLVFLVAAVSVPTLIIGIRGWRRTGAIFGANAALYLLCLSPYLCTGALSHGWYGCGLETNAVGSCRAYAEAQTMYKRNDWDGDGKLTYAASFPLLNTTADANGTPIQLLDSAFATATSPAMPKHGYYFVNMKTIGGRKIDWANDYALCAAPAVYGRTGYRTFIVSTNGTTFGKDLGPEGKPVEDYPADPMAEGWIIAE
jgi:hypothetical protein